MTNLVAFLLVLAGLSIVLWLVNAWGMGTSAFLIAGMSLAGIALALLIVRLVLGRKPRA